MDLRHLQRNDMKIDDEQSYGILPRAVVWCFTQFSRLPMRVLYAFSDVGYLLIYRLLRYRIKVVRGNLSSAFPEKNKAELRSIERKFYHWLADYFVEAIKLLTISDSELRRRFKINGSEQIRACFSKGRDVGTILGHYCNWEWLSCVGMELPSDSMMGLIYKPLHSKSMDLLFCRLRSSRQNGSVIPKNDILRYLVKYRRNNVRYIFGYIADQAPRWDNIHLWLPFLNHDTPVFTGSERLMRRAGNAVFYVEMTRPKRGFYTCTYHLITADASEEPEFLITKRFFALLEKTVRRQPEFYLWSHNRWKRTREEYEKRILNSQRTAE